MKSYASVDRIENSYAVFEVELIQLENSQTIDYCDKQTEMMDVPLEEVFQSIGDISEGDIIVVEHNGENVTTIYSKDDEEKKRRIDCISKLMQDD